MEAKKAPQRVSYPLHELLEATQWAAEHGAWARWVLELAREGNVELLRKVATDAAPRLREMGPSSEGSGFEVHLDAWQNHFLARVVASMMERPKDRPDAKGSPYWNHYCLSMGYQGERFDVTVQRASGEYLAEQLARLKQERDAAVARAEAAERALAALSPDAEGVRS